ncbi:MAG: zinc ribbon domain-containing protein [Candidatus Aenigmatarchaeota archaeon]
MRCSECGAKIERGWKYCPRCGSKLGKDIFTSFFEKIFPNIEKEFKQMEKEIEAFDISPFFRIKPTKGFSIRIVTSSNKPPNVSVKTWGMPKESIKQVKEEIEQKIPISVAAVETTEEPKAEIKRLDSKIVVELDLPNVKSESDISIQELEQSVEIRAIAGKKAYFKIITKPEQFRLVKKRFSNGKLYLEFA